MQGAEWDKLGPGGGQGLQRFGVGKAKGFVLRNGDAGARRGAGGRLSLRCRPVGQGLELHPVQHQRIRKKGDLLLKPGDLPGGLQP